MSIWIYPDRIPLIDAFQKTPIKRPSVTVRIELDWLENQTYWTPSVHVIPRMRFVIVSVKWGFKTPPMAFHLTSWKKSLSTVSSNSVALYSPYKRALLFRILSQALHLYPITFLRSFITQLYLTLPKNICSHGVLITRQFPYSSLSLRNLIKYSEIPPFTSQ